MFHAVAVAGEGRGLIEFVDGFVEVLMGLPQLLRHDINVVEVGEGRVWKLARALSAA